MEPTKLPCTTQGLIFRQINFCERRLSLTIGFNNTNIVGVTLKNIKMLLNNGHAQLGSYVFILGMLKREFEFVFKILKHKLKYIDRRHFNQEPSFPKKL